AGEGRLREDVDDPVGVQSPAHVRNLLDRFVSSAPPPCLPRELRPRRQPANDQEEPRGGAKGAGESGLGGRDGGRSETAGEGRSGGGGRDVGGEERGAGWAGGVWGPVGGGAAGGR